MIQEQAMLVTLNISAWTARKFDGKVSKEVETANAATNAGRFNKLLADTRYTSPIQKAATAARSFHYENTLPWNNNGQRLLPNTNYFEYIGAINSFKQDFEAAVDAFLKVYETDVINDARHRLGAMFNASEFPPSPELKAKFEFVLNIDPVATSDFRLDLQAEEVEKIRTDYDRNLTTKIEATVTDLKQRLQDQVRAIRDKLSDKDAIFRDSLFGNLEDLLNIIPRLNVTGNPAITELCRDAKALLNDPDAVRGNEGLRGNTATEAANILDKMKAMFSR